MSDGPVPGAFECVERHALEQRGLLAQLGASLRDVPFGLGAQLGEGRQDLGADAVAGEGRIEVRLVVSERKSGSRGQLPGLLARE